MFIIAPLVIFAGSLSGLLYLVWKKTPYLRKLSTEDGVSVYHFWQDLFPEVVSYAKELNLDEHKRIWMEEFEKFVRRLHVLSLKLGNLTSTLLRKIKKNSQKKAREKILSEKPSNVEKPITPKRTLESLKEKEQELIVQIAKDPKNIVLYKELGEAYIEMGNMRDAHEALEAAHNLMPEDLDIQEKLSKIEKHLHL